MDPSPNVHFSDDPNNGSHQNRPNKGDDNDDGGLNARPSHSYSVPGYRLRATPFVRKRLGSQQLRYGALRISEYIPEHDCFIPRAPAFRLLSQNEVNEIVTRLSRSNSAAANGTGRHIGCDVVSGSGSEALKQEEENLRFMGRKSVSREELHFITQRVRAPTSMSLIREQRPAHLTPVKEL